MSEFRRKMLPHGIPSWVPDGETFFITINTATRGQNTLAMPEPAEGIQQASEYYSTKGFWHAHLLLLMPDHLHALIAFNTQLRPMRLCVSRWKTYLTRQHGLDWQRNFFDHRIRNDAEFMEKASYIRNNPVRAGLCDHPEDWSYVWPKLPQG